MQSDVLSPSQPHAEKLFIEPCPAFVDANVWIRIHYFARIRKVVNYIEAHLDEPLDLEHLSLVGCMERTSFSKLFKSKVGLTLTDFIGTYRISRATMLMEASDFSVTEIAYAVGFGSLRAFERTFKRVTGIAPSKFRTAVQERMGLQEGSGALCTKLNGAGDATVADMVEKARACAGGQC